MRQFVILGHDAPTTPKFSLADLPGGAGRLDVLCRCINSAFCLSHAIRSSVRTFLIHQDTVTITFDGATLRRLNPDERSTAALIRNALERTDDAVGHMEIKSSPGISLSRRGLQSVLDELSQSSTIVQLHELGKPVIDFEPPPDPTFVLSDHRDFTPAEEDSLSSKATERVRLGPKRLHADHAITIAHNYLDTNGFQRY